MSSTFRCLDGEYHLGTEVEFTEFVQLMGPAQISVIPRPATSKSSLALSGNPSPVETKPEYKMELLKKQNLVKFCKTHKVRAWIRFIASIANSTITRILYFIKLPRVCIGFRLRH